MLFCGLAFAAGTAFAGNGGTALLLKLEGAVTPASANFVTHGLQEAAKRGSRLVILQMDTPGGLDSSMRDIIREILASPVPVAGYVAPAGARAASAGTYIMYASHVAAMAPSTNLGAATPVQIGGGGFPFGDEEGDQGDERGSRDAPDDATSEDGGEGQRPRRARDASEAKAINDAVAYIRGLAELRGRNADWAERAVREAASLSSSAAERDNVIDFTAATVEELLRKADGMVVKVGQEDVTLRTTGLTLEEVEADWRTRLLAVITNPNVALILMMIGIYGLIFEFMNPGTFVPGTIGGISLLVGLYSLAVLPVTFAGVGLILLGIALIVAEAFAPSFGILGIGGAVALVLGATILFDTDVPGIEISWPVIAAVGITSIAFALIVTRLAITARRHAVVSGREQMIGAEATVLEWSGGSGWVRVRGERWRATAERALAAGERVRVVAIDGLTLDVAAKDDVPTTP